MTGALVLVVAAAVIENRRVAQRVPPAVAVETAPAGLGTPPLGTADGGAGLAVARTVPAVATIAAPDRPEPTGPAAVRVVIEPLPSLAAIEPVALPGASLPAPGTLPVIPTPTEVLSWLRAGLPPLDPRIGATAGAGVVLLPPDPVAAPVAVSAPQLAATRSDRSQPVPPRSDGDRLLRAAIPAAPAAPAFPAPPVLPGDGSAPAPAPRPGPRVAIVVLAGGGQPDAPLPDWVRSVAGPNAGGGTVPGAGTLAFADGAWRAGDLALFPDRADPAGFLASRAAGQRAWLVYDRLDAAGADLDARLSAARERARRDGAVVLRVAPDPDLLARIGAWLAEPGAPGSVPVTALD